MHLSHIYIIMSLSPLTLPTTILLTHMQPQLLVRVSVCKAVEYSGDSKTETLGLDLGSATYYVAVDNLFHLSELPFIHL